jgi:MarR family transcriptional regulator, organic hydroperoxide resistance regulator
MMVGDLDDPLRLDRQVCFPLYAPSNMLTRLYRAVLAELDLTYPQYLVLLVLWEQCPQTVGSLGDRLYLDSGTLTPPLKRMEVAGLITRTRDFEDERRVLIGLTPKGRDLRVAARKVPETLAAGLNINKDEILELRDQVKALITVPSPARTPSPPAWITSSVDLSAKSSISSWSAGRFLATRAG